MNIRNFVLPLVTVVACGFIGPAVAATSPAIKYGSLSSPIKAENNSDDGNAWIYGAVVVSEQTWLRNRYHFRDSAPGGNHAYATTTWHFWMKCIDGEVCFKQTGSDRSSDDRSGDWILEFDYEDLQPTSDRGRGITRVCENQNNSPDPCSKPSYATLTY